MIMKKRINVFFALLALAAASNSVFAAVIAFDDAYASFGQEGNPATFYQPVGITLSGTYWGLVGGVANGDPGGWNLNGTAGPAFLGINQGSSGSPTINLSTPATSLQLDVGVPFGWQIDFTAIASLSGNTVAQTNFSIDDNNSGVGTWQTVTFNTAIFDRVTLQMTSSPDGGFAFGVDNIRVTSVPEPTSSLLTISGVVLLVSARRVRSRFLHLPKVA